MSMENRECWVQKQKVQDFSEGDIVKTLLAVASASQHQAKNGLFWRTDLKDASGVIEGRIWSPMSHQYSEIPLGSIVEVDGKVEKFRDQFQLNITQLRVLGEEEKKHLDMALFLPASTRSSGAMYDELIALCNKEFIHKPWHSFVIGVLCDSDVKSRLMSAPAAKEVHHAWVGGLLEHMLSVGILCLRISDHYDCIDRQTLLAGALFHDLGKLWELSGGLENDYTDEGRLIGHINISLEKFQPYITSSGLEAGLAMHFKHLILSHHGFYEYGSPRLPQTIEAFALHYADNLDSKITQVFTALKHIPPGENDWSAYQRTLARQLYQAEKTPVPLSEKEEPGKSYEGKQCSLL